MLCRSKSISDGVNRFETNKVLCLVGGERIWLDVEDTGEFIIKPLLNQTYKLRRWCQRGIAPCVNQNNHIFNYTPKSLNVIGQFCQSPTKVGYIIDQNILSTRDNTSFKLRTRCHALHWVCARVKDPVQLHDVYINLPTIHLCTDSCQGLRNGVIT